MMDHQKDGYDAGQYYELKSFFQDSWIQVPDGKTPSRMMKPRAVARDERNKIKSDLSEGELGGQIPG